MEGVVSRRRKMRESPKRWKDLRMRRLRLVCTDHGRHRTPVFIEEFQQPVHPGRPDLESILRPVTGATLTGGFQACRECGFRPDALEDRRVIYDLLAKAEPGRVLRYDVSRGVLI